MEIVENKTKVSACLILIRNSLNKGNNDVVSAMKSSKHDKELTFNKIYAMMLDSCYSQIDTTIAEKIADPDTFIKQDDKSYSKLLTFNKNMFQIIGPKPKLSHTEESLMNLINQVISNPSMETVIETEDDNKSLMFLLRGYLRLIAIGILIGFLLGAIVKSIIC